MMPTMSVVHGVARVVKIFAETESDMVAVPFDLLVRANGGL